MKNVTKNAVSVSWLLIGALVLLTALIGVLFYFATNTLHEQTLKTNHAKIDNELAETEIVKLKALESYLAQNKSTVNRAADIVAESQAYTYQNQGISDLNAYAAQASVGITSIDFPAAKKAPAKGEVVISGVKKVSMVVTLDGPVDVVNVLRFIKLVEQNLTKMQITAVTLTPDTKFVDKLAKPTLNIEVFVR